MKTHSPPSPHPPKRRRKILSTPFSLQGFLDGHNVPVRFVTSKFEASVNGAGMREPWGRSTVIFTWAHGFCLDLGLCLQHFPVHMEHAQVWVQGIPVSQMRMRKFRESRWLTQVPWPEVWTLSSDSREISQLLLNAKNKQALTTPWHPLRRWGNWDSDNLNNFPNAT